MWYLIKQSFIPFGYLLFSTTIATGVFSIQGCSPFLRAILLFLNLALYSYVVISICYTEGRKGLKVRISNDINRKRIIETGEELPLKHSEEYAPWKGFAIGGVIVSPLIILMICHTILLIATNGQNYGAGSVASILYLVVFAFFKIDLVVPEKVDQVVQVIAAGDFYYALFAIPVILLITGIPYIIGAKKVEQEQEKIKELQKEIHGEEN